MKYFHVTQYVGYRNTWDLEKAFESKCKVLIWAWCIYDWIDDVKSVDFLSWEIDHRLVKRMLEEVS